MSARADFIVEPAPGRGWLVKGPGVDMPPCDSIAEATVAAWHRADQMRPASILVRSRDGKRIYRNYTLPARTSDQLSLGDAPPERPIVDVAPVP